MANKIVTVLGWALVATMATALGFSLNTLFFFDIIPPNIEQLNIITKQIKINIIIFKI